MVLPALARISFTVCMPEKVAAIYPASERGVNASGPDGNTRTLDPNTIAASNSLWTPRVYKGAGLACYAITVNSIHATCR